jgi:hypothetical protein
MIDTIAIGEPGDGTITTYDSRLATPVQWHFGHSNDGSAVRCSATCARIIDAANAAMGSPANNRQVEEPAILRSVCGPAPRKQLGEDTSANQIGTDVVWPKHGGPHRPRPAAFASCSAAAISSARAEG